MTLLYQDPRFLDHDTGTHPECASRLEHVTRELASTGLDQRCQTPAWQPAGHKRLSDLHERGQIEMLANLAAAGGGRVDADTVVSAASFDVAQLASGAVIDAVGRVLGGEDSSALCLVRPPGHHATKNQAMGFCLLNNIALGARAALDCGAQRVLIVDWDVHHGNGTQACFYDDPRVGFFSIHRWPFYPGTGDEDETGTGDGLSTTQNVPIRFGTTAKEYHERFATQLDRMAQRMQPELILVSAGFDSHRDDPVGSLGLEESDFEKLTATVQQIANQHANGRIVSVLEGGYNPPVLARCVATHLTSLLAPTAP